MRNSLLTSKFIYLLRISIVTLYFNQTIKAQSPNNVNNINVSSGTLIFTDPNTIVSPSDNSNVQFSGSAQIEYKSGSLIDLKPGFSTGPFSGLGYFHGSLMSTQSACTSTEVVTNPYGNNGLGLTTLSPCSTYEITYTISSSAVATVEIDLPLGITYNSLPSQTHTGYVVTYFGNQGTGASKPIFDFTNAPGIVTFVITVNVPCSQTGSATTGIVVNGTQGCDPISQLQITLPILQVVAWPLAQLPANIASGSCGQLVYKLTNGGSGVMNYINVNLTGIRSNIILSSYYTDPTIGSIDMARCSSASSVVIASGATSIDLNNLNLGPGEFIFLHICYCAICHDQSLANALQNHIGNSDNSFVFNWGCSNGNLCSSSLGVVVNFSISDSYIPSLEIVRPGEGIPIIFDLSSYGFAPNITNSSLCDATISASLGTTTLYYRYTNNSILINNHTGAVNITDLKIYLSVGTVYGSIDLNSFKITTLGGYSVSIPFSTYFASASNPFISTGGETIVLDFSLLPSTFSLPNGPNGGLADVDGDHQVDDLAEGKSFVLSFDYNYSATCPPNFPIAGTNDNFSVSTCALYQNQCGTIPSTSNISTLYTGSLPYGKPYAYSNDGDVPPIFIAPTDVDATVPSTDHFNLTICPEFIQTFQPYYFNFDCLGGFHRISVYLPPGYHLDISSPLLPLIINTDVINSCHPGTSTSPETVTAIVTEIPAGTAGLADLCRGLVNIDIYPHSGCNLYSYYKIDCFPLPLYLDCPSSYCSVVSGPSTPADQFRFTLSNICNPGSCPNCIDSLVTKTTETVHHCYGPCAPVSGFGTLNAAPNDLFTFFRSTFGKDNSSNTTIGYDCNYTGATEVLTPPYDVAPIRTDAAYPGDEVQVKVNGTFGGNPANYSHICLQIRYDDLLLATGNNQIFDINAANSNIDIFDDLGNSIYTCPISAIHFSQFNLPDPVYPHDLAGTATLQGKDEMYFELDNLALGAMASFSISHDPINHIANFKFKANLHLIVRSHNTNTQGIYFNAGENPFQLRTEFLGFNTMHWDAATSSIIPSWEFSCDDWGNHFNILQPSVDFLFGVVNPTTCSPITATFTLRVTGGSFGYNVGDFPYEFKPYATLNQAVDITVPNGYTLLSAGLNMMVDHFVNDANYNNFNQSYNYFGPEMSLTLPSPVVSTNPPGNTYHFNGFNGACWPLLDCEMNTSSYPAEQQIVLHLQAECNTNPLPSVDRFKVDASITENIGADAAYQNTNLVPNNWQTNTTANPYTYGISHANPTMTITGPGTSASPTTGNTNQVTSYFELCPHGYDISNAQIIITPSALGFTIGDLYPCDTYGNHIGPVMVPTPVGATLVYSIVTPLTLTTTACYDFILTATFDAAICQLLPNNPNPTGAYTYNLPVSFKYSCTGNNTFCPIGIPNPFTLPFNLTPANLNFLPIVTVTPNIICAGVLTSNITASSVTGGMNYTWTRILPLGTITPSAGSVNGNMMDIIPPNSSPYNPYIVTGTDGNGCHGTASVAVRPTPTMNPASYTITKCANASVSENFVTSNNVSGTTYAWSNNNPTIGTNLASSGTGNISFTSINNTTPNAITSTFNVTPTGPPSTGSSDEPLLLSCPGSPYTFTITINPVPGIDAVPSNITVCSGTNIPATQFNSSTINPVSTFTWSTNNTTLVGLSGGVGNVPDITAINNGSTPITATITITPKIGSCSGTPLTYTITVEPSTNVQDNVLSICDGASVSLSASGAQSYSWSPATGLSNPNIPNPIATPTTNTNYEVTGSSTYTLSAGSLTCTSNASTLVTVNPSPVVSVSVGQSTICQGQTISLTASPSSGVNYSWSAGAIPIGLGNTASASPNVTTTYTVIGNIGNCSSSSSTMVTVNPVPNISVVPNQVFCSGVNTPPINFSSTVSGATYYWNNSNTDIGLGLGAYGNLPSFLTTNTTSSPITSTIHVFPTANSCSGGSTPFTITIIPTPTVTLNAPISICQGQTVQLDATGVGTSFDWTSSTGTNPTGTGNTVNATPSTTTTYNVTSTYVSGSNSCSATASTTVTVNTNCCYDATAVDLSGQTSSGGTFSAPLYTINGIFTVDGNVTFSNTEVILGPQAEIHVLASQNNFSNNTLTIINSHLHTCGIMWNGIIINGPSTTGGNDEGILIINGSTIEEGINAVFAANGAHFSIINSVFNNNYRSIRVMGGWFSYGNMEENISGNTFNCTGNLLPPHSTDHSYSYIDLFLNIQRGIVPFNSYVIGTNDPPNGPIDISFNTFNNNVDYAVRSDVSNVAIANNTFNFPGNNTAVGVYSTTFYTGIIDGSLRVENNNHFWGGKTGVKAERNESVKIEFNDFHEQQKGVDVSGCGINDFTYHYLKVGNNYFNNLTNYAISAVNNPYGYKEINHNTIEFSTVTNGIGIIVQEIIPQVWTPNGTQMQCLGYSNIFQNTITKAATGIWTANLTASWMESNTLDVYPSTSSAQYGYGILAQNSSNSLILLNTISNCCSRDWWINGISTSGTAMYVGCNTLGKLGYGLFFDGDLRPDTYVMRNSMTDEHTGILLHYGVIGPQGNGSRTNDNEWNNSLFSYSSLDPETFSDHFNGANSTFIVKSGYPYQPINNNSSPGFNPITVTSLNNGIAWYDSRCNTWNDGYGYRSMISIDSAIHTTYNYNERLALAKEIISEKDSFPIFESESRWKSKNNLYRMLIKDSIFLNSDTALVSFKLNCDNGNMGILENVAKIALQALAGNDSVAASKINFVGAKASLNSMIPANETEINLVSLYSIILQNHNNGLLFDSTEINIISDLANRCPFSDGPAVYMARALMNAITGDFTNYINICERAPEYNVEKKMLQQNSKSVLKSPFNIYPNPNDGNMILEYSITTKEKAELIIYDIAGKKINTFELNSANNKMTINENELSNGIYFYEINVNDKRVQGDKLVIIK